MKIVIKLIQNNNNNNNFCDFVVWAGVEHAGHLRDAAPEARQPARPRHGRIAPAQTNWSNGSSAGQTGLILVKRFQFWSSESVAG